MSFFCKLNVKDQCFLHSYIYNGNKIIYRFIKTLIEKKYVYGFLIKKNTFICWTRLKTVKLLATAMQKELCFLF